MASNETIDCALVAEVEVTQEVAITKEIVDVEIITNSDSNVDTIPRIEVELAVTQWSLVSDAIFIKNITGEEPQWFIDMIDDAIRNNDDLIAEFEDIQVYLEALNDGYTNLVSVTDDHTTQLFALKVSSDQHSAAITVLNNVKITEKQASAISNETITAWMRGGESAAWFNEHVQAVATDTSANTLAIIQLSAEVDGISAGVIQLSEALVEKYENPEWDGTTDPDPQGQPQWIYEARAKHSLEVNANGSISGFVASAENGPEGSSSSFKIYADEFLICDKLDPDTNEPGTVAFSVRFDPLTDKPTIFLNGDVYFGEMPEYEGIEYTLYDIAMDSVVDPIEKTSLEKMYKELIDRDNAFLNLVYSATGRYNSLTSSHNPETRNYTDSFAEVTNLIDLLNIRGFSATPENPYLPTKLKDISLDRDGFNDIFFLYDAAYTTLDQLMSDLVKRVADDSYNIMVNILEDNIISGAEKYSIINYTEQIEAKFLEEQASLPLLDFVQFPDCGYAEYSRSHIIYSAFSEYQNSIYAIKDEPIPIVCPAPTVPINPALEFPLDGLITRVNDPIYDIFNPDCSLDPIGPACVDTVVGDIDAQRLLASTRWFVDARAAYENAKNGGVIDVQYFRVGEAGTADSYTLIIDDTIATAEIGYYNYFIDDIARDQDANYVDFKQGAIHLQDPLESPVQFIIDSEAAGHFENICDSLNTSNIRAKLIEGSEGSFGTLYSGSVIMYADKKYVTRPRSILSVAKDVDLHNLSDSEMYSDYVRFYAPTHTVNTQAVNDYRIQKLDRAGFTAILTGPFSETLPTSEKRYVQIVLEARADDGPWVDVPNQVATSKGNQTILFEPPLCSEYVDFRMRISYWNEGFIYEKINTLLTVMLNN